MLGICRNNQPTLSQHITFSPNLLRYVTQHNYHHGSPEWCGSRGEVLFQLTREAEPMLF